MTALDACPCGATDTHTTPGDFPARFCAGCGAFASRCAEPDCETFADHQTDDGLGWCEWHCPEPGCVEGRAEVVV